MFFPISDSLTRKYNLIVDFFNFENTVTFLILVNSKIVFNNKKMPSILEFFIENAIFLYSGGSYNSGIC